VLDSCDRCGTVAALLLIGLVMVASASSASPAEDRARPRCSIEHQIVYVLGGLVAAMIGLGRAIARLEKCSIFLLVGASAMLILVLVPGTRRVGERRAPLGPPAGS
jgi:cell division protein FtsW (lipid II flippase)